MVVVVPMVAPPTVVSLPIVVVLTMVVSVPTLAVLLMVAVLSMVVVLPVVGVSPIVDSLPLVLVPSFPLSLRIFVSFVVVRCCVSLASLHVSTQHLKLPYPHVCAHCCHTLDRTVPYTHNT